jgi:hypothetical protein
MGRIAVGEVRLAGLRSRGELIRANVTRFLLVDGMPYVGCIDAGKGRKSLDDQVGILRVLLEVIGHGWADHIDFHLMLTGPLERRLGQGRGHAVSAQGLGNLSMDELKHLAGKVVLEVGDLAIALQFEAAVADQLG